MYCESCGNYVTVGQFLNDIEEMSEEAIEYMSYVVKDHKIYFEV